MQMVWHYDKVVEPEFPGRYVGAKHVDHQTWHSVPTAAGRGLGWSWWWRRTYVLNSVCCPEEHCVQVLPSPGAKAPFLSRFGRSEEHTSELQSLRHLVCRLLLEKKKTDRK